MIKIVRTIFPFFFSLMLLGLGVGFWNPCGILCMMPLFYYLFIRPIKYFWPFALAVCLVLDYRFGTVLFWTVAVSAAIMINRIQNYISMPDQKLNGVWIFMIFCGVCFLSIGLANWSFFSAASAAWLTLWIAVWYVPATILCSGMRHD
ncbi:MAG: hypothetical protein LBO08_03250 [Rickettsiales bacterium]|nr:hypothetical protein [Rickettsiales bacterium]